jgi:cytochrome c5
MRPPSNSRNRLLPLALAAALALAAPAASRGAEEGEAVYKESCTQCHDAKTRPLDGVRMTREQWKDAIERMEGQGAQIPSGKKLSALLDWLERTHGPASPAPADKK